MLKLKTVPLSGQVILVDKQFFLELTRGERSKTNKTKHGSNYIPNPVIDLYGPCLIHQPGVHQHTDCKALPQCFFHEGIMVYTFLFKLIKYMLAYIILNSHRQWKAAAFCDIFRVQSLGLFCGHLVFRECTIYPCSPRW